MDLETDSEVIGYTLIKIYGIICTKTRLTHGSTLYTPPKYGKKI